MFISFLENLLFWKQGKRGKRTTRTTDSIVLYMPPGISSTYGAGWKDVELTDLGKKKLQIAQV